jgi:hypothetical protein
MLRVTLKAVVYVCKPATASCPQIRKTIVARIPRSDAPAQSKLGIVHWKGSFRISG